MLDDILKNMSLFVDGRGFAGNVEELTLPKLTMKVEEFRNGGMDAPVEVNMGMEKLESEFTLTRFDRDALKLFGVATGNNTAFTVRGSVENDAGTRTGIIVNMRGMIKELDYGTWKPGDKATLKAMLALRYYKLQHGDEVVHEIDVVNMVRTIGGVDQLAEVRTNLGL